MEDEGGFDGVCICTGTNTWASLPCFKGQECFKGEIMHSEKYRSAEVCAFVYRLPVSIVLGKATCSLLLFFSWRVDARYLHTSCRMDGWVGG